MSGRRNSWRPALRRTGRKRRGIALLVVLLLVVLLEVVVGELAIYGWLSLKGARNYSRDLQGLAAADGILRALGDALSDEEFVKERVATLLERGVVDLTLGEAVVTVAVEDENAKLNLNLLADASPSVAETAREELLALFDVLGEDSVLAGRIAEFLAEGTEESDEENPEERRGLTILDELRLVEGVTDELLFGSSGLAGRDDDALRRYLTCWGDGAVNINTAPRKVLEAVLAEVRAEMVDSIMGQRSTQPFESLQEVDGFLQLPGPQRQRLHRRLTTESDTYQLIITCRTADLSSVSQTVLQASPTTEASVLLCRRLR